MTRRSIINKSDGLGPVEAAIFALDRASYAAAEVEKVASSKAAVTSQLRRAAPEEEDDDFEVPLAGEMHLPHAVAVRLMWARLLDGTPALMDDLRNERGPIVSVAAADADVLDSLRRFWSEVAFATDDDAVPLENVTRAIRADACPALELFIEKTQNPQIDNRLKIPFARAMRLGLPLFAFAPVPERQLPRPILDMLGYRLIFPALDATTIVRTIEVVTAERASPPDASAIAALSVFDLSMCIRPGRTARECVAALEALARRRTAPAPGDDIALKDIHGADEAVDWIRAATIDLRAWRRGQLRWPDVGNSSCVLVGPPGTAKSMLPRLFAREAGLHHVVGSYSIWQKSKDGHLGHCLAAMEATFEEAKRYAPSGCCLQLEELDSFSPRERAAHPYFTAVVNGLLECLSDRVPGLFCMASTNSLERVDPAVVRAGRFDRIIQIGLPDASALTRMLRVRLRDELPDVDLAGFAAHAVGMSGADIERAVRDARATARRAGRRLEAADLAAALGCRADELPHSLRWRAAVHEAGHITVDVAINGPAGVSAVLAARPTTLGMVVRRPTGDEERRYAYFFDHLRVLLAGRLAEEIVLRDVSDGASGRDGDLHQATEMALYLVSSSGLAGPHPLLFFPDRWEALRDGGMRRAADAILRNAASSAEQILLSRRSALVAVAERLMAVGRIDGVEVEQILDSGGAPSAVSDP